MRRSMMLSLSRTTSVMASVGFPSTLRRITMKEVRKIMARRRYDCIGDVAMPLMLLFMLMTRMMTSCGDDDGDIWSMVRGGSVYEAGDDDAVDDEEVDICSCPC